MGELAPELYKAPFRYCNVGTARSIDDAYGLQGRSAVRPPSPNGCYSATSRKQTDRELRSGRAPAYHLFGWVSGHGVGSVNERLEDIIRARLLVASLGERASAPWWRSQASTEVSGRWLERLFPRTAARAALEISSRAALAVHDAKLGGTGVYHLFRLPVSLEAAVHDVLARNDARVSALLESTPGDGIQMLAAMAGSERVESVGGPLNCGRVSTLQRGRALQRLCAAYVGGFQSGAAVFPYLEPDEH